MGSGIPMPVLLPMRKSTGMRVRLPMPPTIALSTMSNSYLEVTYCQGKPFAAYLYLNRVPGDKSVRTQRHGSWIVDFAADGRAIGIEFTDPGTIDLSEVNRILLAAHQPPISDTDLAPLRAA
jgi:hypothetical protein